MYSYLYQNTNTNFSILHGLDGFDEISLTDDVKIISNTSEAILKVEDFNLERINLSQIQGGKTTDEAATIFYDIISGKGTKAQNDVVCANAAVAISTINKLPYIENFALAKETLENGKALEKLKNYRN